MTDYVQDLDKTSPTEFDPVADGAREIRDLKIALRNTFPYANSALYVSNESLNILLNETIPNILDRLNDVDGEGDSTDPTPPSQRQPIVASCKYNARDPDDPNAPEGTPLPYSHNVISVEIPAPNAPVGGDFGSCRVTFQKAIPEFDMHFSVLVQPYATSNRHVIATITDQRDEYVEWTWLEWDGSTWKLPQQKIGFSFMAVDYEQS